MIGSKKAAVALAGLLGQKAFSADRKPRVIAALGRLKDPSAIKPLLETLKTPSPAVKSAAIDALVAIVNGRSTIGSRDEVIAGIRAVPERSPPSRYATARSPPPARSAIARRFPR